MIKKDQPTIFGDEIVCGVSSREDGQMQLGWAEPDDEVVNNRRKFLESLGVQIENTVLVRIRYIEGATYDVIKTVSQVEAGNGMFKLEGEPTDCLVTNTPGLALFVPVADCGATIIYDSRKQVLALAHLGRHSSIALVPKKLTKYLSDNFQTDPADLKVWISPSISAESYVLKYANFATENPDWADFCKKVDGGYITDNAGFNKSQFIKSGVRAENIEISNVDTARSEDYWSHHHEVTVKGNLAPPRFAVAASLKTNN
jgi:copper oxidase (laccase) domain-containing protein